MFSAIYIWVAFPKHSMTYGTFTKHLRTFGTLPGILDVQNAVSEIKLNSQWGMPLVPDTWGQLWRVVCNQFVDLFSGTFDDGEALSQG